MNQIAHLPDTTDVLSHAARAATEHDYTVSNAEIKGKLPETLRGTFFRMGPGRYEVGNDAFGHAFDGDGMVHSVTFTDQGVKYINRYVRTPKYLKETQANGIVYRSLGHNAPGGWRKNIGKSPANCANTNVMWHGGHLLALWEGGRPYELDPATLDTLGEFDYGGRLNQLNPFSAHGKVDPRTGDYYNFGMGFGPRGVGVYLYRIDPRGCLDKKGFFKTGMFSFLHDFALTEHYAVFFVSPLHTANPVKALLGLETYMEAMTFEPQKPTRIYVVSLKTFEVVRTFETEGFIPVHFSNSWEEGNELVVHVTHFTDWEAITRMLSKPARYAPGHDFSINDKSALWQYRLNLATGKLRHEALPGHDNIEFMQWDYRRTGVKSRITYANAILPYEGSTVFNGIQRQDHKTGKYTIHDFGAGTLISEAVFAPREKTASEEDGYLLTAVYRAATHTTDIVVLDAKSLEELALVPLRTHIPLGFHCGYTARAFR